MSTRVDTKRVLAGAWGTLRVDNIDIAEATSINADIEIKREPIQWGLGEEEKIVGVSGSGTIILDKVYTRFYDVFEALKQGKDKRFDLYIKKADPDAVDGQIETISIPQCWLKTFPLGSGEKTTKQTAEYTFGFNPMRTTFADIIK